MARYKHIDTSPRFIAVDLQKQLLPDTIAHIFSQVPFICDQQGLIGREMFAIDGVKLPSNASKAKSGTRADFERQAGKLETAANKNSSSPSCRRRKKYSAMPH